MRKEKALLRLRDKDTILRNKEIDLNFPVPRVLHFSSEEADVLTGLAIVPKLDCCKALVGAAVGYLYALLGYWREFHGWMETFGSLSARV